MISQFIEAAEHGRPVFITDLRRELLADPAAQVEAVLILPDGESTKRFTIPLPELGPLSDRERELVLDYVRAEVYNHLATLGGYALTLYFERGKGRVADLLDEVVEAFQIDRPRAERTEYGRIVNMLDRINDALHPSIDSGERRFTVELCDIDDMPSAVESVTFSAQPTDAFGDAIEGLDGTVICGLDIGGTDIKGALEVDGTLLALKEYDWNPASYAEVEQIITPIVTIARLLRVRASLETPEGRKAQNADELTDAVSQALAPEASIELMQQVASHTENVLGDRLRPFDAIGLCFPDVVIRNRIVGGEVPKTQGMRRNAARDFERQFARLTALDTELAGLCRENGVVMNTNDGPMAAFTAAVELAASATPELCARGVFAHSLGTDLGTGLVCADGTIPEIPLEVYNLILDLGSDSAREFPPEDLRSLANTNTGIPGTPQKLASQAGAFRLADAALCGSHPDLVREIEQAGFVAEEGARLMRFVPESPVDKRKPYLAYLMDLAETVEEIAEVFRTIGEYLAVVYAETEYLLGTGIRQRFLFGRFVKIARCFELLQEGATRRDSVELIAADSEMAYTPLMKELDSDSTYTVAQFGQAVGAIYFANSGRLKADVD